ncbi:MAG TPA: peptidase M28 family protein, partial [Rhodanobacter sp.]
MPRLPLSLLAASLLLAAGAASAADTVVPASAVKTAEQLRDKALDDGTAMAALTSLTTEVGPRLAGSGADQRARDWAVAKFKALGFDKVYTEPVTYPLWVRRHESGAIMAPFPQPLVLTALGYSPGTPKGGLSAQVVGFDSLAALKAADPATIKGKIVYVGYRMQRHQDGHDYGMGSAVRVAGPVIAAEKGAAGY